MHGIIFDIGLGLGLAAACGLRPFLPMLLAGALASSSSTLEVRFGDGSFHFLQATWWLLAVVVVFVLAYALQLLLALNPIADVRVRANVNPLAAALAGCSLGAGALLFAGTLSAHGELSWPGALGGLAVAALAQAVALPVISGARARLSDRAAREALTVYLDAASLLVAGLTAALHPLGYVMVGLLAWFWWRRRARGEERYAGLRILRR